MAPIFNNSPLQGLFKYHNGHIKICQINSDKIPRSDWKIEAQHTTWKYYTKHFQSYLQGSSYIMKPEECSHMQDTYNLNDMHLTLTH
jgi:hypothetical protein